jgi:hypothetical protein
MEIVRAAISGVARILLTGGAKFLPKKVDELFCFCHRSLSNVESCRSLGYAISIAQRSSTGGDDPLFLLPPTKKSLQMCQQFFPQGGMARWPLPSLRHCLPSMIMLEKNLYCATWNQETA